MVKMSKRVSWLTNKNGEWVKSLEITEELWKKSIEETLRRMENCWNLRKNSFGTEAMKPYVRGSTFMR